VDPAVLHIVEDAPQPQNLNVFLRGNVENKGPVVEHCFLEIPSPPDAAPFSDGSGRRELAERIASADNPLTARVFVNRVLGALRSVIRDRGCGFWPCSGTPDKLLYPGVFLHPEGLEPPTIGSEDRCSIQLSSECCEGHHIRRPLAVNDRPLTIETIRWRWAQYAGGIPAL
jgi:hypothetical protein